MNLSKKVRDKISTIGKEVDKSSLLFYCFFGFSVIYNLIHLLYKIDNPLRELEHGFRQCQTAISAFWLTKTGFKFAYETPILGPPWSIPIEFASYQYVVAALNSIFELDFDISGRVVSIVFFYLSLVLMFFILSRFKFDIHFILLALSFVLLSPIFCFWPRAFMYETTALALSLAFVLFSMIYFDTKSIIYLVIALLFGVIAAPTKITTFYIYWFFTFSIFLFSHIKSFWNKELIKVFILFFLPILASTIWNLYTDLYKNNHLIAYQLSSSSHWHTWIWTSMEEKFNIDTWDKIITESMFVIKIFPFFLFMFFLKYWKQACISLFFWLLGPFTFTKLYYVHGYYNVANGLFLSVFISFILYSLFIHRSFVFSFASIALTLVLVNLYHYKYNFFYQKSLESEYRDIFFTANNVKKLVKENEAFVIFNADWNPELPYYAQRKAIMMPGWFDANEKNLTLLKHKMGDMKIAGVAVLADLPAPDSKVYQNIKYLGFNPDKPIAISQEGYWWHWYVK